MNEMTEEEKLLRNLKDAGCDETTIKKCLQLQKEEKWQEQYRILSMHRVSLLDRMHVNQQMIDSLDFLIYALKKNKCNKNKF